MVEEQYKLTAMGWGANSPTVIAEAMDKILRFSTTGAPRELLQMVEQLFYNNKNNTNLQDCGLNLLSHLVSGRWEDLSDEEKQYIFSSLPKLIGGVALASAWSTKNKMAIVLTQLIEKGGTGAWAETWAKLVAASTAHLSCDEIKAERTIVTCLSEGITIPGDNLKDRRSKDMRNQNWDWLSEALFSLIHKHLANSDPSKVAAAQQHYDLALCIANTASAYAEWGEVKNLVTGVGGVDLINSWKVQLGYDAFFPATFAYLSEICLRARPTDGCDHGVLMDIFYLLFDQLKTLPLDPLHVAFGFRKTVCLCLVSVKEALGPDFEHLGQGVGSLLEKLNAHGSITDLEYHLLREKLCGDTFE